MKSEQSQMEMKTFGSPLLSLQFKLANSFRFILFFKKNSLLYIIITSTQFFVFANFSARCVYF